MRIIFISSAAIFLAIFIALPTVMFVRHVGMSPRTYHEDDDEVDHIKRATIWHDMITTEKIEVQQNNSNTREGMSRYNGVKRIMEHKRARPLQVAAGSRLPDCSHACRSCTPCRLAMVSLACASHAEAETCPISYRCICNSKSYPVP